MTTTSAVGVGYDRPDYLTVPIPEGDDHPGIIVSAHYDEALGRYVNDSVSVSSLSPVTSTRIKRVPLHRLITEAMIRQLGEANRDFLKERRSTALNAFFAQRNGRRVAAKRIENPTRQQLADAMMIRDVARSVRAWPNVAIARSFGLNLDEAKSWVRKARRTGLIDR